MGKFYYTDVKGELLQSMHYANKQMYPKVQENIQYATIELYWNRLGELTDGETYPPSLAVPNQRERQVGEFALLEKRFAWSALRGFYTRKLHAYCSPFGDSKQGCCSVDRAQAFLLQCNVSLALKNTVVKA